MSDTSDDLTPVPSTDPAPPPSLGASALDVMRAERAAGYKADPPTYHAGKRVALYFAPCVRGGKLLGLTEGNWCAASASWACYVAALSAIGATAPDPERFSADAVARADTDFVDALKAFALTWNVDATVRKNMGLPPFGYRAAVSELVADARATNAWHDVSEMTGAAKARPASGDLLLFARGDGDPRTGGTGHVVIVEADGKLPAEGDAGGNVVTAKDSWVVLSGNAPGGTIGRETRTLRDVSEKVVGFIAVGG